MKVNDTITVRLIVKPRGWHWKARVLAFVANALGFEVEIDGRVAY